MSRKSKELPRSDRSEGYVVMYKGSVMTNPKRASLPTQNEAEELVDSEGWDTSDIVICELVPVSDPETKIIWRNAGVEK